MADFLIGILAAASVAVGILAWGKKKGGCSFCPCEKACLKAKEK